MIEVIDLTCIMLNLREAYISRFTMVYNVGVIFWSVSEGVVVAGDHTMAIFIRN